MNATAHGRDLYIRHTATDGKSVVREHRVWDADRFIAARKAEAEKLNADVKDGPRRAKADQITREQYLAERS